MLQPCVEKTKTKTQRLRLEFKSELCNSEDVMRESKYPEREHERIQVATWVATWGSNVGISASHRAARAYSNGQFGGTNPGDQSGTLALD